VTQPLTKHPAKFSEPILEVLGREVTREHRRRVKAGHDPALPLLLVDPFAGVGRCHQLCQPGKVNTIGVEIEPDWAACNRRTICADSLEWMLAPTWRIPGVADYPGGVDIVATSPTYGNRMADHHDAKDGSTRRSYRHDLGRMPTDGSSAVLHWGPAYWRFHATALACMFGMLWPGGLLLYNVKDLVRGNAMTQATLWHLGAAIAAGFEPDGPRFAITVPADGLRYGENHGHHAEPGEETRAAFEVVYRLRKPDPEAVDHG
jgi:hypothetical protein